MVLIDGGINSVDTPGAFFGGDHERLEKCKELIRHAVWKPHYQVPPANLTLRLAREVFPSLNGHEEPLTAGTPNGLKAERIATALLEQGDVGGAIAYVSLIAGLKPAGYPLEEDHLTPLNETLLQISAYFQKQLSVLGGDDWMGSIQRDSLTRVLKATSDLPSITDGKAFSPILGPVIAKLVYKAGDLALFQEIFSDKNFKVSNPGTFVVELDDLWLPAKKGQLELQQVLLAHLAENAPLIGQVQLNKAILAFWKGVDSYIAPLKSAGDRGDWRILLDQGLNAFNIGSIPSPKPMVMSKQLFPMLAGICRLGCEAKKSGIDISTDELRVMLKPLETISEITGRSWVPYMGGDYKDMKADLCLLFEDIAPNDLSKRPLPKHLASALSDVLGNTQWVGKANKRDRGRILSDDLGL